MCNFAFAQHHSRLRWLMSAGMTRRARAGLQLAPRFTIGCFGADARKNDLAYFDGRERIYERLRGMAASQPTDGAGHE